VSRPSQLESCAGRPSRARVCAVLGYVLLQLAVQDCLEPLGGAEARGGQGSGRGQQTSTEQTSRTRVPPRVTRATMVGNRANDRILRWYDVDRGGAAQAV